MLPWLIMANTDKRDGIKKSSIGMMMTMIIMIEGKKGGGIKKGTGTTPSIMGNAI